MTQLGLRLLLIFGHEAHKRVDHQVSQRLWAVFEQRLQAFNRQSLISMATYNLAGCKLLLISDFSQCD